MNRTYEPAGQIAVPTPREPTLNERLNGISNRMQSQCERIEQVLGRINGTPAAAPTNHGGKITDISPTLPLATVVEHLESVQSRLMELAIGVEKIA